LLAGRRWFEPGTAHQSPRSHAVEPTLENVGVLGIIVLIRTVLSFSLDIEIEGVLPWRRVTRPRQSQSG